MKPDRLIQMAIRIVFAKLLHKGINKGIDYASTRGKSDGDAPMTPEEKKRIGEQKRRMSQGVRTVRRFGRFR